MFSVYRHYPFKVPFKTKVFNFIRYLFTISILEQFLIKRLTTSGLLWRKFIPPLYFYNERSDRTTTLNGIRFEVDISKLHGHSIYFRTIHDNNWDNLFKLLKPNFNIVDAGANIGYLSLSFANYCKAGMIYSFEPDSQTFAYLQRSVTLNNFNNIKLYKTALGASSFETVLYKPYVNNPGANRILRSSPGKDIRSEVVAVTTLDSYLGSFQPIDLIKIDVEGYELFVLQGALEVISKWKPILFIELADDNLRQADCTSRQVIELVEGLGYAITDARTMSPLNVEQNGFDTDIICHYKHQK